MDIFVLLTILFAIAVVVLLYFLSALKTENKFLKQTYEEEKLRQADLKNEVEKGFASVAREILDEKVESLEKGNRATVQDILSPLSKDIQQFRQQVENVYVNEAKERHLLKGVIENLMEQNKSISKEANNLTQALRGKNKVQGDWGEMILERVLEDSGLVRGREYDLQHTISEGSVVIKNENTARAMRPDAIVHYPQERDVIVDSKVSLSAYYDFFSAETEEERKDAMKRHLASVKGHIRELSTKDYSRYHSSSLEFVVLFFPNEGAFNLALQLDPNLWMDAYNKKVVLMGPLNLIAMLRSLLDLWKKEYQIHNIQDIVKEANNLYDKFVGYAEKFNRIGSQIDTLQKTYDEAYNQLTTGKGNIVNRLEKMRKLGLSPSKSLPSNMQKLDNGSDEKDS
ncbi:MAG: DNA recombination protein RmuC [Porphyromonas sp.]|nr:DNA recombination protein RmuC [Porphyromonas sp.]